MASLEEFLRTVGASKDAGAYGGYNATYNIGGQTYYVPSDINHSRQYGNQLAALASPYLHQEYKDRAIGIDPGGKAYGYLEGVQGAPVGGYRPEGGNAGYQNQYAQHVADPAQYQAQQANMQRMMQSLQARRPETNALQNAALRRVTAPKMPGVESTATAPTTTSSVGTPMPSKAYSTYRAGRRVNRGIAR